MLERLTLELLVGLGYLFELDTQNDDFGNVVASATVGPKVRLLETRQLWASLHVGYVHLDGHQGGFDTALGYDLGLGETRDLSVFLRYALTVRGTATLERDQHFDALLMAGVGLRFGRIGVDSADSVTEPEPEPEPVVELAPVEPEPVAEPAPEPVVEPTPVVEPAPEPVAPIVPAAEPTEEEDDAPYVDVDRAVIGTHAPYIVRFAYDDDTIRGPGLTALRKVARWLRAHPEARRLRIVGHTDPRGDEQHNARLSANRARAVREWLIREGFPARRFEIVGVGAAEPLVPNAESERDHGRNRRVELIVTDAE